MTPLSVITCEGCGKCCDKQGTPPFSWAGDDRPPDALKWDIHEHARRYDYGLPCLWFDAQTKLCLHYEQRPEACRTVLQPGGELCLQFRAEERP